MRQIRFTKEGYNELKAVYDDLLGQRPAAVEDLRKAREMGDLSENGYYRAARAKLSSIDGRLRRLSYSFKQATIVESTDSSMVGIGSTTTVSDGSKETTYHIVGDLEAKPSEGKISLLSPVGLAIAGKRVGEKVTITIPTGTITYTITKLT